LQKTIFSSQLTGEHLIDFQNSQLNWRLGYSYSNREQPDLRRVRYSTNDTTQPYRLDLYSLPQGNSSQAGRFYSSLNENAYSGGFDYKIPFGNLNLKIGTLIEDKNRDFKVRSFTIVESKNIIRSYYDESAGYYVKNYTDPKITDLYYINDINEMNPSIIFNPNNFYLHGLGLSEDTKNTDSYKANESVYAGYFMVDFPVNLFERKLKVIAGARYEVSQQVLNNYFPFYNDETKSYYDSTFVNKQFNDILPSLNLVYELNNKMNLRVSATQTLARPSLREYAPFTFYDFLFQSNVKGNPNLKRALIQNYDIRYEWFTNPGEVFSISGFYKIFDNAIEETILPTSSEYDRTFTNAQGKAFNYGIEFETRKNLGFIADFLNYFSVNANLAIIKSEITVQQVAKKDTRPMWGQSPYTLNVGLYYFNPDLGTSLNLSYNTYGKRIIQVADVAAYSFDNPHIYEMPRNLLDVSLSQKLFDFVNIKLSIKNLLNDELVWEQNGKQVATNIYGTNYNLSFDFKF
jgi:TonB-dependent receptor